MPRGGAVGSRGTDKDRAGRDRAKGMRDSGRDRAREARGNKAQNTQRASTFDSDISKLSKAPKDVASVTTDVTTGASMAPTPDAPTAKAKASTAASKAASAGAALKGLDIEDNPAMAEAFSTQPASSSATGPTGTSITQPKEMSFTDRLGLTGRVTKANLAQLDDASVAATVAAPGGFAIPAKAAIEGAAFAFGGGVQKFGSGASGGERGKEGAGSTRTTSPTSVASTLATTTKTDETDEQRAERLKQRRLAGITTSTGTAASTLFG